MTSRENILSKIRLALENTRGQKLSKPDFSRNPYIQPDELPEVIFAENFKKLNGDFFYCEDLETFLIDFKSFLKSHNINNLLVSEEYPQQLLQFAHVDFIQKPNPSETIEASLGLCELLIARTGSILISSHQKYARTVSCLTSIHMVLAFTSQLVFHLKEGLEIISSKYANNLPSLVSLISGSSTTNAIQKSWMPGALGPKKLVLFLVDDIIENHSDSDE